MALSLVISIPLAEVTSTTEVGELLGVISADLIDAGSTGGWAAGKVFSYSTRFGTGILATVSVVNDECLPAALR